MINDKPSDIARADAIEWFETLKTASDDVRVVEEFLDWFEASPENAAAWQRLEALKAVAASDLQQQPADQEHVTNRSIAPTISAAAAKRKVPSTTGPFTVSNMAAALLAIAIGYLAYTWLPDIVIDWTADHVTATAQTRTIKLADGSKVTLGAYSALNVRLKETERKVEILRGVAFFDVKHSPRRPFIVDAAGVDVRVAGTAFEVRRISGGARVAVAEGAVVVSNDQQQPNKTKLSAGRGATFGSALTKTDLQSLSADKIASWRTGTLFVKGWTVGELLTELRRHYRGIVIVGDLSGWSKARISGTYSLTDPVQALRLAAASQGLVAREIATGVVVISPM